ncbi:MAG: DNA replication terminus site-binding protein [Agitococcus sp.]|nr:DNA replication terminus site-binding protein [Agitococcus sp.]
MIVDIRNAFESLKNVIDQFNAQWVKHVVCAEVFVTPLNQNGLAPKKITVNSLSDDDAIEQAVHAFQSLYFQPNQHPATAFRLSGWIGISQDLSKELANVNQHKDTLKTLIHSIPEKERNRITRQALPNVSLLQCYRHLVQWSPAPECVYFSWAGATPSSVHVTKDTVHAQLNRALVNIPEQYSAEEWQVIIDLQRQQLDQVSIATPLIYRWLKSPHPRIMAYNKGQKSNAGRIVPANLPVFVVLEDDKKPKVYGLSDFNMEDHVRETPRADSAILAPVIESMGLYAQISAPAKKYTPPASGKNDGAASRNSGTKNYIQE